MRIVDRKTFLAMPTGTVFSKYRPCYFDDLLIKGDSLLFDQQPGDKEGNDFFYQPIADSVSRWNSDINPPEFLQINEACELATVGDQGMDLETQERDGLFDYDQLFAVWSRQDVEALIARLADCLTEMGI